MKTLEIDYTKETFKNYSGHTNDELFELHNLMCEQDLSIKIELKRRGLNENNYFKWLYYNC